VAHHSLELLAFAQPMQDPADVFEGTINVSIVPISGQLSQTGWILSTQELKGNGLETQAIG
jgi:hypothetical protein